MLTAWMRMFMPAVDPEYVLPDAWLALTPEQQRAAPYPEVVRRPRRVAPASEREPGFSLDDVGPYWKLDDGTVFRDRASAADRSWREEQRWQGVRQILDMLPARRGKDERIVRGRTPERVLDALVSYGLVHGGMSQVDAARHVLEWTNQSSRSPKKYAEQSRIIWLDVRLPPVKVPVSE